MPENTQEQLQHLIRSVDSLTRAIVGTSEEGNVGLLMRVHVMEVSARRFRWLIPFLLFASSSLAAIVTKIGF